MPNRWVHCCTHAKSFGFRINEKGIIDDVDYPDARANILRKHYRDQSVIDWVRENTYSAVEVKSPRINETSLQPTN